MVNLIFESIMAQERLQKILSAAGVASRRKSEELIEEGSVRVNKKVVTELPVFADIETDIITVNGKRIYTPKKVHFLLNKPKGVICTNSDPRGRKRAIDLINTDQRIVCAGRLDIDTTGLIIVTNDNELVNRLTHPRYGISKTYLVKVKGKVPGAAIEKLKKGVWLSEGKTDRSSVKILKRGREETSIELVVKQGKNRQVRRMFAKVGFDVKGLKRSKIGKLTDRGIGIGKYRPLMRGEVKYLWEVTKPSGPKGKGGKKKSKKKR